jgi:molybdate transport system permease protein
VLPTPTAPRLQPAAPLRFELHKRLGDSFRLALHHDAASPRLALLGPSGSGKSLTLRLLAGITGADRAEISAGTLDLARLGAEQRNLGYLPQHSALLPRRTVWQQVNFAVDADPALAAWWLDRLGLTGLQDRFPDELSGGQQRRVALVRALARAPSLILLDEPFSALDAPVRARLYRELRRLQHETGLATVLVTHDPEEAALLADEVIVLDDGVAVQQGTIADVFAHPASPAVAALLGIPNTHAGRVLGPDRLRAGALELAAPTGELTPGRVITWTIRPEEIGLASDQADPESGAERGPGDGHPATVVDAVTVGAVQEVTVALDGLELIARTLPSAPWRTGEPCRVTLPSEAITVWPSDNGSWPVDNGTWHVDVDAAGRR